MKKSDELISLEEKFRELKNSGRMSGDVLEFAESMFNVLIKNEARLSDIEDRLMKLEDFSDIISMDLFEIQSEFLKHLDLEDTDDTDDPDDIEDLDEHSHIHHHHHDGCSCCEDEDEPENEEEEDSSFVRCPFCNTLIFINETDEDLTCPFCGEKFMRSDIAD